MLISIMGTLKSTSPIAISIISPFFYGLTITFILSLVLSVDAIRCHQCNSHSHEDCARLIVNTPRAQRDNHYLKECEGEHAGIAFCRKTIISFDVNDEKRIERSCGWIQESHHNACFTADNEGYQQVICTCTGDGCNGAPEKLNAYRKYMYAVTFIGFLISTYMKCPNI